MSDKIGSGASEQSVTIAPAAPSHSDVRVGHVWINSTTGIGYICTGVGPIVFTALGHAPADADYLVGTINGSLSAEIVVGTTPGGELGGTWDTPTVDTTHSGSAHHTRSHDLEGGSDHVTSSGVDGHVLKQTGATSFAFEAENYAINFIIDGGGSAITTGVKGYVQIETPGTIQSVTLLADQSGSIVVDIWKDTYANYPPVDADSITASAPPTITTANKSTDATLTGWTTTLAAGDILGFNVDSITTCQRVTLVLKVLKT